MAREDYAHWNEEADIIWWQEEGRHESTEEPYDPGFEAGLNDWEDFDDEDDEIDTVEVPVREDFGWSGGFE